MVAPAGAGPWPQITSVRPRFTSCTMMGTSPPGPFRCGSTTCSVKAVATPASKALPPFSSVAIPTAVAIQCVDVTTPNVPSISGRVVNGFGLMTLMPETTAHSAAAKYAGGQDVKSCLACVGGATGRGSLCDYRKRGRDGWAQGRRLLRLEPAGRD